MPTDLLHFNGVDGSTGEYLLPPLSAEVVSKVARGALDQIGEEQLRELKWRTARTTMESMGPVEGVDPKKLEEAGWGVIFANVDQDKVPALKGKRRNRSLICAARRPPKTIPLSSRFMRGRTLTAAGKRSRSFARHGAGPGPADPAKVPYYLLLVGDPEAIPTASSISWMCSTRSGASTRHAGGVRALCTELWPARQAGHSCRVPASFFGVANEGDRATKMSAEQLVAPLAESLKRDQPEWAIQTFLREEATKERVEAARRRRHPRPALLRKPRARPAAERPAPASAPGRAHLPGVGGTARPSSLRSSISRGTM